MFSRERHHVEHHIDVSRDNVLQCERCAAIMDVNEIDAGQLLELLTDEMAARADTLRGICQTVDLA